MTTTPTPTWQLDGGRIVVGERLRSGAGDEVRSGWLAADPTVKLLITFTRRHGLSPLALRNTYALDLAGIAPLEYVGLAEGTPYEDALVERIVGRNVVPPLDITTLTRVGAELAATVMRAHSNGNVLDGIRPELVFVGEQGVLLAPRGPSFIATTAMGRGMRSYSVPFLAPEQLVTSKPSSAADVFSLCATLYFLGTGRHPFGDPKEVSALAARLVTGTPDPWPGDDKLGAILGKGLAATPADRPTPSELATAFAQLP